MGIDPLLYEKYSGRKGDPNLRKGAVLSKAAKNKQERDAMPKGVTGGLKVTFLPGIWANLFFWVKNKEREKGD